MALTTLSGAIAGLQMPRQIVKAAIAGAAAGRPRTYWAIGGYPPAGAYDTTLNGVALTAPVTGQIPYVNPASGNGYLARFEITPTEPGCYILADRLWHNGGYTITSTSAQNSTTPAWPSRSADGTANGEGVFLACEISATTGAGTPTITCSYTNQSGTAGRSATNVIATAETSSAASVYFIGLQAGDTGVGSLQSVTLSATWTSGTMNMVAYRELARLEIRAAGENRALDVITGCLPRMYDGSVPYLIRIDANATFLNVSGSVTYAHG